MNTGRRNSSLWVRKEKFEQNIKQNIPNNKNSLEKKLIPQGKEA